MLVEILRRDAANSPHETLKDTSNSSQPTHRDKANAAICPKRKAGCSIECVAKD